MTKKIKEYCSSLSLPPSVFVGVCVCVIVREREREGEGGGPEGL